MEVKTRYKAKVDTIQCYIMEQIQNQYFENMSLQKNWWEQIVFI